MPPDLVCVCVCVWWWVSKKGLGDMHLPPHQQPLNVLCLMRLFRVWGARAQRLFFWGGGGSWILGLEQKAWLSPISTAGAQKGKQKPSGSSAWLQLGLKGMAMCVSVGSLLQPDYQWGIVHRPWLCLRWSIQNNTKHSPVEKSENEILNGEQMLSITSKRIKWAMGFQKDFFFQ